MSGAGRQRRPEFSQHWLRSRTLASRLVDLIELTPSDLVLEVGPGRGVLTEHLLARASRVVAVEIDPALAAATVDRFGTAPGLQVVTGDFLRQRMPRDARVVANLPYAITSDAVRHIVTSEARDAHLIVQREAAERFAGSPYGPETLPSLLLKPWWHIEILQHLRRTDFEPPPRVDSAYLWLARRTPALVTPGQSERYRAFIRAAFGEARTTRESLRRLFTREQADRLQRELRLDTDAPPSAVRFEQWLALYRAACALERVPPRGLR